MKKVSPLVAIGVRNGLIAGFVSIVLLVAMYYMGRHPLLISPILDFRIVLFGVFIFFTLREFRENHQAGVLHFWQGMISSLIMVMVVAIFAAMLLMLFCEIEPTFVSSFIKGATDYFKSFPQEEVEQFGKEAYERNLSQLAATNSKQMAIQYFAQSIMIGLFVSIIMSVVLRKQPKP